MLKTYNLIFLAFLIVIFTSCSSKNNVIVQSENSFESYDEKQELITKSKFDKMSYFYDINEKNIKNSYPHPFHIHWLHNYNGEVFSIAKKFEKYGILGADQDILVDFIYDEIQRPFNGYFIVKKDDLYGYLDDDFELALEPLYLDALNFHDDIAYVKFLNERWGCIDDDMDVILEGTFDKIFPRINSLSKVKLEDKWGFINEDCELITDIKYDYVYDFSNNFAKVEIDGKLGYINKEGEEVIDIKYDFAQEY